MLCKLCIPAAGALAAAAGAAFCDGAAADGAAAAAPATFTPLPLLKFSKLKHVQHSSKQTTTYENLEYVITAQRSNLSCSLLLMWLYHLLAWGCWEESGAFWI